MLHQRKLDIAINTAIVLACTGLVFQHFASRSDTRTSTVVGARIQSEQLGLPRNSRGIILVLSTSCQYCVASAPFHKRLVQIVTAENIPVVAVFPQPVEEGRVYLDRFHIAVTNVKSATLDQLHVHGTPTILAVDAAGRVSDAWIGLLSLEAEDGVIKSLVTPQSRFRKYTQWLLRR